MSIRRTLPAVLILATASAFPAPTSAQVTPRAAASTRATAEVSLTYPSQDAQTGAAPTSIRIDYGQPHLRGRALHTDSLVPYDTPWRTGANAPTTLTSGVDLVIGGQNIAKGSYVLWTLPSRNGWKLIVQRPPADPTQAGTYSEANDVARIDLRRTALQSPVESLSFWLIPSTAPGPQRGELRMAWGASQLSTEWAVR